MQGVAGGAGGRAEWGAGVPRAHTPGLCSGFGSQAAGLVALGPCRSPCSQGGP